MILPLSPYFEGHRHHVEEGGSVQVIQKLSNGLIIGANGERFAMGNEIADRIQV